MKFISGLILILCLPLATALIAGNQESIILDVSPSSCIMIDEQNNSLTNYSTDGLNLTINGNNVTINTNPALMPGNYTLVCNYSKEETTSTSSGSSGSSGGYTSSWICGNWSECIDNETGRLCIQGTNKNINYTQTKSCVSETEEPEEMTVEETKVEVENKPEVIKSTPVIVDTTNRNVTRTELPTEEQQGWVYLGIIIITIMFVIFGTIYFIGRSNS